MNMRSYILGLSAGVALAFAASPVLASTACDPIGTGTATTANTDFVTTSTSCAVTNGNDDVSVISQLLIGSGALTASEVLKFSTKWDWVDPDETLGTGDESWAVTEAIDIGFSLDPNPASPTVSDPLDGLWKVASDFWSDFSKLIIVQKDGNADPGSLVAFTILSGVTSGIYETIFYNKNGDKNISHISAFVVEDNNSTTPDVPLPAALPLLGGGIAILGFVGMRKRRSTKA